MQHIIHLIRPLTGIAAIACIIVITAITIDLLAGLHKARLSHQPRRSWILRRTVSKFIAYIGSLMIALGIDIIIRLANAHQILHLTPLTHVPAVTSLLAIFLLTVEIISIRETADTKTRRHQDEIIDTVRKILNSRQHLNH